MVFNRQFVTFIAKLLMTLVRNAHGTALKTVRGKFHYTEFTTELTTWIQEMEILFN